ncbi:MAG: cobalamin-binding protein [Gammaproteobacteria bacterium]|nr:cobalamin-binding protein [Gammaproteobacteria bacterium]
MPLMTASKRASVLTIKFQLSLLLFLLCYSQFSIARSAQRIVALSPHSVELLFAIGAGSKIVGSIDSADYPDAAKKLNFVGNYHGLVIEKIIALKPDLIISWASGNKTDQIEQLKKLGFNVVNSDPKSLDDIAENIRLLGQLTDLTKKSEQVAKIYEQQLAEIKARYQTKAKIKVFYQLWSKPLMTISNKSWINQLIENCGATNVFANNQTAYPQISIENVLVTNPQVILIPSDNNTRNHDIFGWEKWTYLEAIKNHHIYYPDATLLHRPTPRLLTAMAQMCQQIDRAR